MHQSYLFFNFDRFSACFDSYVTLFSWCLTSVVEQTKFPFITSDNFQMWCVHVWIFCFFHSERAVHIHIWYSGCFTMHFEGFIVNIFKTWNQHFSMEKTHWKHCHYIQCNFINSCLSKITLSRILLKLSTAEIKLI